MKKIFIGLFIAIGVNMQAQQLAMFTEYMHNEVSLNPAYAGSHEVISATFLGRTQWRNLDVGTINGQNLKGINSYSFNAHTPLRNENIGVGISTLYEKITVNTNFNFSASLSYKLAFKNSDLHFGLQLSGAQYQSSFNELDIHEYDPSVDLTQKSSVFVPNFGIGAYYFAKKFYFGISSPQLLNGQLSFGSESLADDLKLSKHYYVNSGYVLDLIKDDLKFKPTIFLKYVTGARPELDFTSTFIIKDLVWIGGAWRSFDSVSLLLGLQVTEQFKIGYSYDQTYTTLNNDFSTGNNRGTHEVVLNYRFSFSQGNIITPRYF